MDILLFVNWKRVLWKHYVFFKIEKCIMLFQKSKDPIVEYIDITIFYLPKIILHLSINRNRSS